MMGGPGLAWGMGEGARAAAEAAASWRKRPVRDWRAGEERASGDPTAPSSRKAALASACRMG